MKHILIGVALGVLVLAAAGPAVAGDEEVMTERFVIALKTDDFEIDETDLGHLGIGDAETIVTDSGKTIDLLRTEDGIEVYVDGELLDIPMHGEHHVIHEEIEIVCDSDDECEELEWTTEDGEIDLHALHADADHKVIMIRKEIDGSAEDIDIDVEMSGEGDGEKVIIIRKKAEEEI